MELSVDSHTRSSTVGSIVGRLHSQTPLMMLDLGNALTDLSHFERSEECFVKCLKRASAILDYRGRLWFDAGVARSDRYACE